MRSGRMTCLRGCRGRRTGWWCHGACSRGSWSRSAPFSSADPAGVRSSAWICDFVVNTEHHRSSWRAGRYRASTTLLELSHRHLGSLESLKARTDDAANPARPRSGHTRRRADPDRPGCRRRGPVGRPDAAAPDWSIQSPCSTVSAGSGRGCARGRVLSGVSPATPSASKALLPAPDHGPALGDRRADRHGAELRRCSAARSVPATRRFCGLLRSRTDRLQAPPITPGRSPRC